MHDVAVDGLPLPESSGSLNASQREKKTMAYQTVRHSDASPNNEKRRWVSSSKHLSRKVIITPTVTIPPHEWFLNLLQVTLVGVLAISGCTSEHSNDQSKQTPQEKESTAHQPAHKEVGEASWYGPGFHGQETSSGETFDQKKMTAAHPSLPMGTKVQVTNLENDKKVEVKINDRGPFAENRVIDLSGAAANKLDMKGDGTAQVKVETKPTKKKSRITPSRKTKQAAKKTTPQAKQ